MNSELVSKLTEMQQGRVNLVRKQRNAFYFKKTRAQLALEKIEALGIPTRTSLYNRKAALMRKLASRRLRRQRLATPEWADRAAMAEIKRDARLLSALTGEKYAVDHIVPIAGAMVCGLNVHYNMRVIPSGENSSKRNRFSEQMLDKWVATAGEHKVFLAALSPRIAH